MSIVCELLFVFPIILLIINPMINVGTETFTAVETTTGKNPAAEKWYEKSGSDYFRTTDTTPAAGKTYYTRTVSNVGA